MIKKITLGLLIAFLFSTSLFAQYSMEITANYSIPLSSEFSENFQNGYGGDMEVIYQFEESGFAAAIQFGLVGFRATKVYEQKLADGNQTIFTYDYKINHYSFPLIGHAKYIFFREKEFRIIADMGIGVEFMETKEKQVGEFTSDYKRHVSNEFVLNPNLAVSYQIVEDIAVVLKSGYHHTLGMMEISYININIGVVYKL